MSKDDKDEKQSQVRTEEYYKTTQAPEPPGKYKKSSDVKLESKSGQSHQQRQNPNAMPEDAGLEEVAPMKRRKRKQPQVGTEEYYKTAQAPEPPKEVAGEGKEKPVAQEKKTPKQNAIEGVKKNRNYVDDKLPPIYSSEKYGPMPKDLQKRIDKANEKIKAAMDQVVEIFDKAPDNSDYVLAKSGAPLNAMVAKPLQPDYVEQELNANNTTLAERKGQEILVNRIEKAATDNVEELIQTARQDVVDANARLEQKQVKKQIKESSPKDRTAMLAAVIKEIVTKDPNSPLNELHEKLERHKDSKGNYDFGLSEEQGVKLYEAAQKIKDGKLQGDAAKEEVQSMRSALNESMPTSQKLGSAVTKSFSIGTRKPVQAVTKSFKIGAARQKPKMRFKNQAKPAARDSEFNLERQETKPATPGSDINLNHKAEKPKESALDTLQKADAKATQSSQQESSLDALQRADEASKSNKNTPEKTSDKKMSRSEAVMHTAKEIVSKVKDLIKPSKSGTPTPPVPGKNKDKGAERQ